MKNLKEEFGFIELEDRLEMVQFVVAANIACPPADAPCDSCDNK